MNILALHGHCWGQGISKSWIFFKLWIFLLFIVIVGDRWELDKGWTSFRSRNIFPQELAKIVLFFLISLLEPFWPDGTGCARGFLSALDAAWMVRSWSLQVTRMAITLNWKHYRTLFSSPTHLEFLRREKTCTACSARRRMRIWTRTSKIILLILGRGVLFTLSSPYW